MRCIALASGSKGNSIYIEGAGGALIIDAGLSRRELLQRLREAGGREELVCAILVTHEHTDHLSGLDAVAKYFSVPVYATEGTLYEFLHRRKTTKTPVRAAPLAYNEPCRIGDFTIEAFETSHDAREPCGFRISENGLSIGCCTDTGVITSPMKEILCKCDGLILESNHCPDMLRDGPYPEMLKRRIRSKRGHLSNPDAAGFLKEISADVHEIMLAHLSEVNNTPDRALKSALDGVGLYLDDVNITVAQNPGIFDGWPVEIRL